MLMSTTPHATPGPEENLLGITSHPDINLAEAEGFLRAEAQLASLPANEPLSAWRLQALHKVALGHLYEWAGQWRRNQPWVGAHETPAPGRIPQLMAEFQDELQHRELRVRTRADVVELQRMVGIWVC